MNNVWIENLGKFERIGAWYTQRIYFQLGNHLAGYSKPRNQMEEKDKQKLLMDMVSRLKRLGYIDKASKIEYYKNWSDNPKDDELLFTLYKTRFVIEPKWLNQEWLCTFLLNIYSSPVVTYGERNDPFAIPEKEKPRIYGDNAFSALSVEQMMSEKRKFKSLQELQDSYQYLITQRPKGEVEQWYLKVLDKNPRLR